MKCSSSEAVAPNNWLFLGAGDLALACASLLQQNITLVRRNPRETLFTSAWARLDLRDQAALRMQITTQKPDCIVFCAAPNERTEQAYRDTYWLPLQAALSVRAEQALQFRAIFCASTAVYAEELGGEVRESDSREPQAFNGRILRTCEALLQPGDISVRLSGLYRPALDYRSEAQFAASLEQPALASARLSQAALDTYSNRIHLLDAARALLHAANLPSPVDAALLINVSDTHPASGAELQAWLRGESEFVRPNPPRGKRVNVEKLSQSGFVWRFPNFKAGYSRPDTLHPC
jgi:nucleoside-diphosphate-sugar epimerase